MTYRHAKVQGKRSVGSDDRVETNGRTDGLTDGSDCITSLANGVGKNVAGTFAEPLSTCDLAKRSAQIWLAAATAKRRLTQRLGSTSQHGSFIHSLFPAKQGRENVEWNPR